MPRSTPLLIALALALPFAAPSAQAQAASDSLAVVFGGGVGTTAQDWVAGRDTVKQQAGESYTAANGARYTLEYGYLANNHNDLGTLFDQKGAESAGRAFVNGTVTEQAAQVGAVLAEGRKLLLVGHSQGALYANSTYDKLVADQVPVGGLELALVGSAANRVAGGGGYITSRNDGTINLLRWVASCSPANVNLPSGHWISFYAANQPDEPVGTPNALKRLLDNALARLTGR